MEAPSMVHRSGDRLIIRSVVSGDQLYLGRSANDSDKLRSSNKHNNLYESLELSSGGGGSDSVNDNIEEIIDSADNKKDDDSNLPQCKIKRNYSCNNCNFFTQNPRHFLAHLRDVHGEKIIINECKHCLYASRHYQKLVRHMKMVHGSTDGLEEQAQSRKRASQLAREEKKRKLQLLTSAGGNTTSSATNLNDTIGLIQSNVSNMVNSKQSISASTSSSSTHLDATNQMNNNSNEVLNQKFLKCTLCDYTTLYRTQMVEHEREEHNKTKFFRCQKCSYVTHIKARFSKHVKYHSMPMIKCVMCDFRTPYKWNLDRHMKNHGGAGPFKCSACNFTADIKQSLTVHEMNHHVPPVGHATGMSMARRRNKVGGTDLLDADYGLNIMGENSDGGDGMDNNNSDDAYENSETASKRAKYENDMIEQEFQSTPADLSQKPPTPKKSVRPLPNLIPIQPIPNNDAVNLSVRNSIMGSLESLLKSDPSDLRMKSSHSVLKDFASLFVSEEVFDGSETSQLSPVSNASSAKRKNTNFFNELKEKFATGSGNNLLCECGHASKCLSEAIIHKKTCGKTSEKNQRISPANFNVGTSTRCQYCRHRCKTSTDLIIHLQSCAEARSSADSCDSASEIESNNGKVDVSGDLTDEGMIDLTTEPHPMENKVFIWNTLPQSTPMNVNQKDHQLSMNERDEGISQNMDDNDNNDDEKADESTYFGIETAPGYGEVTKKMSPSDEAMQSSLKKVFKCPHCSFWASTASRFHVHIVGHLNKKPFECSLCSYRSNWRWDITKHIRLKTIRDVSHKSAKVLMNDETGRRNYTKYNKYITLMKVTDEDGDPKNMKSGEMTPNQEAAAKRRIESSAEHDQGLSLDDEKPLSLTRNALTFNISNNSNIHSNVDNNRDDDRPADEDANAKKVSFKCKKCNFRHSNRDVVLAHVKGHYKEANMPIEEQQKAGIPNLALANVNEFNNNVYVNGILSALSPQASKLLIQQNPQLSQQTEQQIRIQTLSELSGNPSHLFLAELKQQHQQQQSTTKQPLTIPSLTQNANTNATNQLLSSSGPATVMSIAGVGNQKNPNQTQSIQSSISTTTTANNDNNEMDEASSGLNSVNGWRGTAPYRCGHCHQVSNWKHVIQRHCRLKHDGDIQIEIKLKGTNDVYQPLTMQNSNNAATASSSSTGIGSLSVSQQSDHSLASTSTTGAGKEVQSLSFLTKQYPIKLPVINDANHKSLVDTNTKENVANDSTIQQLDADQRNMLVNMLAKQSILYNGNILALIKPQTEYRCQICNFDATNEAALTDHIQIHLYGETNMINLTTINATQDNENAYDNKDEIIDLDDVISPSKVPNKAFIRTMDNSKQSTSAGSSTTITTTTTTTTTTNSKQLQKIQERPILSNGNSGDKLSVERVNREDRCPHCPFTTMKSDVLKEHMLCHICVSGQINLANCDYCDFSIADESLLTEHNRIHFGLIKSKQKPVAFYTSYDNLEITTIDQQNNNNTNSINGNNNNNDANHQNSYANIKTLYPKINFDLHNSSDKENKILVDVDTGHLIK